VLCGPLDGRKDTSRFADSVGTNLTPRNICELTLTRKRRKSINNKKRVRN
jgi:hypothetical protein